MKKKKSRLIVSLLTAFIMAFTVIPYMGAGSQVSAAEGDTVTFTFTPSLNNPISKVVLTKQANGNYRVKAAAKCTLYDSYEANGKAVTVSFFDADRAEAGQTSLLAGYGVSQNVDDHLYSIAGTGAWTEIEPGQTVRLSACAYYDYDYESGVGAPVWYDDTKGYKAKSQYAVAFTAPCDTHSYSGGKCTVCGMDYVYKYNFKTLTATATENNNKEPVVEIECGEFDSPDGFYNFNGTNQLAVFRESNGKIRKLAMKCYEEFTDNIKINYGTKYTYYIVDLSYVTGTANTTLSNVGTVDETLTDDIKTALTDSHVTKSNTVTTKSIIVSGVKDLKVYKKGVRTVSLDWGCTYGADQYLTGYIMQSYNSAGKPMQTKTVKRQGFISGESIYIPYEGTSKVKVTPYEDYTDGKRYYGSAQTISVTSAPIAAPGGHVTKISSKNARVVATKATGATGLQVQQKVGKKWKTVTSGSKASTYKKTWKKNKAGKTSYRYRSYIVDQGKTYYSSWKTYKPKSNVGTYTKWAVSYMRNLHGAMDVYFIPTKIQYKGSKIKVTGRFINTWRYAPDKGKFKVTFKVDGKSIGYKTIKSKSIKANSYKTTTFYLSKAKKGKDLRSAGYSVKTYY